MRLLAYLAHFGLALSVLFGWIFALAYIAWAIARSRRRSRLSANSCDVGVRAQLRRLTGHADVTFEARWGLVLALPALELSLLAVASSPHELWAWLAFVPVVCAFGVVILAEFDVRLRWWARWWPASMAIVGLPLLVVSTVVEGGGWGPSSPYAAYAGVLVLVGVRFARAVGRRDHEAKLREAEPMLVTTEPGFVWPY